MNSTAIDDVMTAMSRADVAGLEPFDDDALAGDWFEPVSDPHYSRLPCYVSLDDEDDAYGPFDGDDS